MRTDVYFSSPRKQTNNQQPSSRASPTSPTITIWITWTTLLLLNQKMKRKTSSPPCPSAPALIITTTTTTIITRTSAPTLATHAPPPLRPIQRGWPRNNNQSTTNSRTTTVLPPSPRTPDLQERAKPPRRPRRGRPRHLLPSSTPSPHQTLPSFRSSLNV
ncbi:hypothetical protein T439DRAFT_201264 [Meredithblackwellia eburnea MCA 4105]